MKRISLGLLTLAALLSSRWVGGAEAPPPDQVSARRKLPDEPLELVFSGSTSKLFQDAFDLFVIEATSNLTDWQPVATLLRTNSSVSLTFSDSDAAHLSLRSTHLLTPFPEPSGSFAVGTFARLITDPSRSNRTFMARFWYPAAAQPGDSPSALYGSTIGGRSGLHV